MTWLKQAHTLCQGHGDALRDALQDMGQRKLTCHEYEHLNKEDRRLLDQFAYRFTRLQDDMGTRLMPAALRALGEEISAMPTLDRFTRLEQLGWLPSADEWMTLRQVRNQFVHDYPDTPEERFERLQAATEAAFRLLAVLEHMNPDCPLGKTGHTTPFVVSCELAEQSNHERPFDCSASSQLRANGFRANGQSGMNSKLGQRFDFRRDGDEP